MSDEKSFVDKQLQPLLQKWPAYTLGVLGLVSAKLLSAYGDLLFDSATHTLGKTLLMQLGSVLLFSLLISLVLLVQSRKKKGVFSRLKPVPGKGYEIDTLTREAVCPRCTTDDRAMPMRDVGNNYFCWSCNQGIIK
jgi:hypothetical protein